MFGVTTTSGSIPIPIPIPNPNPTATNHSAEIKQTRCDYKNFDPFASSPPNEFLRKLNIRLDTYNTNNLNSFYAPTQLSSERNLRSMKNA